MELLKNLTKSSRLSEEKSVAEHPYTYTRISHLSVILGIGEIDPTGADREMNN
jgi:hypothetical protein